MNHFDPSIINSLQNSVFKGRLELEIEKDHIIIKNSKEIRRATIAQLIIEAHIFPLISEERLDGNLVFTATPYAVPPFFKVMDPQERVWGLIDQEVPIWRFFRKSEEERQKCWRESMSPCILTSGCKNAIDRIETPGRALDLGCGTGARSRYLLEKGWSVDALDNDPNFISQTALPKLNAFVMDVEKFDFKEKYDLIVAYGILHYTDPAQFKALMQKIYGALNPNGLFLGTMLRHVTNPNLLTKLMKLGTWFIEDRRHAENILKDMDYREIECVQYEDFSAEFEFKAKKE